MLSRRTASRLGALVGTLGLLATLAPGSPWTTVAQAAGPFVVDTTDDTVDAAPGDGTCADSGGACSLRAAVQETNASAGADLITVPAGTYTITRVGRSENAAATGDLDVTGPLTIAGAGAPTVAGGGLDRIFEARSGATLTVDGLTVTGGNPGAGFAGGILTAVGAALIVADTTITSNAAYVGGGIVALGPVTVTDSTISANTSASGGGGIVAAGPGPLDITATTISNNTAAGIGGGLATLRGATVTDSTIDNNTAAIAGGIYAGSDGTLAVTGSTITDNTAFQVNAFGGGILAEIAATIDTTTISYNDADIGGGALALGALTVADSTFDHNNADVAAAGIGAMGPTLVATNSTLSSNTTAGSGGGIAHASTATLTNVTITDNLAVGGGGGIYTLAPGQSGTGGGTTTLASSIVGPQTIGADCAGTTTSSGYNLASDASCNLTGPGDQPSTDAQLGPLQDNGGPTPTHLPFASSPGLDTMPAGTNGCGTSLTTDQRSTPRPQSTGCESGAVESISVLSGVGAGQNFLGTGSDPADAIPVAYHENQWLAVSGPCASAENGDGLQAITDGNYWHDSLPHETNPGLSGASISWRGCQATNSEDTTDGTPGDLYEPDGYFYAVDVPAAAAGNDLYIDIYDAPHCGSGGTTSESNNSPNDATGNFSTTYTVRNADATPGEPADNPVVSTITFVSNQTTACGGTWQGRTAAPLTTGWRNLTTIPAAQPGTYYVQVQTTGGVTPNSYQGSNQFSLRASYNATWSSASSPCSQVAADAIYSPTCPAIRALEWLGTLNNLSATSPSFWAAAPVTLPPGGTLEVDVYDPGEGALGLEVLDPLGRSVDFDWEVVNRSGTDTTPTGGFTGTVTQPGGVPCVAAPPGCTALDLLGNPNTYYASTNANYWRGWNIQPLPFRGSRSKYSDRLVHLSVQLPADPVSEYGGQTRFRIRYTMGAVSGANTDRTMWRASVQEAPTAP